MSATMASKHNDDGSHSCSTGGGSGSTSSIASAPATLAVAAGTPAAMVVVVGWGEQGKPSPLQSFFLIYIYILYILM
jgi:hypothetical protein